TPRQLSPTPERYKEIQQALADKGYLKSDPSGVWDADSIDAMKRFQADRKQDPTGKLTAAGLIDLGLGPTRNPSASPEKATPEPVTPPAPVSVDSGQPRTPSH
ncbi:MAG: peptidoglycan-binding protein, partial [Acidobacteriota bacterium]|nr:peptidoglycan-binding protein [Acidobacteriota bacterium]